MVDDFSKILVKEGCALPFGASFRENGVNFALFSKNAASVSICLFHITDDSKKLEIVLDDRKNRTGHVWHVCIENLPDEFEYAYKLDGIFDVKSGHLFDKNRLISDPYAKNLALPHVWGEEKEECHFITSRVTSNLCFDWGGIPKPNHNLHDLVIYEMHVRGFTMDPSSKVQHPGTFRGVIEKIPYLKSLGVNAVELMPIFEFDECHPDFVHPTTKKALHNYWGYSPVNFFCPMHRYSSLAERGAAIIEFKEMVRELHKNGIEVILDVVFNHTSEGSSRDHYLNYRGIDNAIYYMLDKNGEYLNFSGCGNTFNCNHYAVRSLILDSMRYWVSEMQVDGFRFDLASILTRKRDGTPLPHPPLIIEMSEDPVLFHTKLIAEPWDAGGLYQLGHFPSWGRWSEWNGFYRDVVRRFIKGSENQVGLFAEALCGSQNIYGRWHHPFYSINFITAHDGFSLYDLVSYNEKHNWENGEENRDGNNYNDSWNCGHEGPTTDPQIRELRERQLRNFFLALFLSQGIPMILMGDEYGHTRNGNNNTWNQDNKLNWFTWDKLEENKALFHYVRALINFRKNRPIFRRIEFLKPEEIDWHGSLPFRPNWDSKEKFIAFTLKDPKERHLYIAFNADSAPVTIHLPPKPLAKKWYKIVDTGLSFPENFQGEPLPKNLLEASFTMLPYSAIVAELH